MTTILDLSVNEIDPGKDRARELDPGHARALADSIQMQGLIVPIVIRKVGAGYRLVAGLHRLEAFRILGRETIPAILSDKESDDEARLDEVMENLARRMIALDFCKHLFELKQVWNRLYPQTKNGGDRRSEDFSFQNSETEIPPFREAMAEKFNVGKSAILEAVAIWNGLSAPSRVTLRGTAMAEKKTELKALSKESRARQAQILALILDPAHADIQNVAEALFHLENGVTPNALERRFLTVSKGIASLDDALFDRVIEAQEARIIASLKRRGRL